LSEEFSSEEQDRTDEPDKNAAFFPQKLQSSYQNPTQNQVQLFSNLFGTFNDSGNLDTALEALEGMANLPIASQGNGYSVKLKIGDYPVVTGKVEPDVIRPMTGWESFKWDFGKVVPYIPYVNVLNDAKIALTGSDFAGYYASPGEQQDAKFQTVLNVATVGIGGLLGAELKSLRGVTEEIGVVSKGLSNAENIFAGKIRTNDIPNMSKNEILEKIPSDWKYTENNDFVHMRDADGNIRMRIDPPDKVTNYDHVHLYDEKGNPLDASLNIIDRKSPDAHIPYQK